MEKTFANIAVNKINHNLCLEVNINNKISRHETKIDCVETYRDNLVFYWIMHTVKPLFLKMPMDKIEFEFSKEVYAQFKNIFDIYVSIITVTNNIMKGYSHLKGVAKCNKNILFFNVDDNYRYKYFYEKISNTGKKKVIYMNMNSGFNVNTRTWEDKGISMPLDDLIDIIVNKSIKKIISINLHFLDSYFKNNHVYLISLFNFLGVEYITIDNDSWDSPSHGYLMKSFFNCDSFNRFSLAPTLQEYWDNKYELKNVHYISVPQNYEDNKEKLNIKEDYAVLVLSNSRLINVKPKLFSIIYLLDHMPQDSVFTNIYLWYMSMKYAFLKYMQLNEFEQLIYNCQLYELFYLVMQFLKYEIIDSIDATRQIEIYGDVGWEKVFPEYYKKLLNAEEKDELFLKKNHLYLLFNASFSYLEASGPIYDAIKRNVPFINIPAMVKTHSFDGFRHIEYRNKEELNCLIENIGTVVDNVELKDAKRIYRKVLSDNENMILERIVLDKNIVTNGSAFDAERKEHQLLIDQVTEEYINQNAALLKETFRVLFLEEPRTQYDVSKSKYFNKKYVQRILKLIRDEQDPAVFT